MTKFDNQVSFITTEMKLRPAAIAGLLNLRPRELVSTNEVAVRRVDRMCSALHLLLYLEVSLPLLNALTEPIGPNGQSIVGFIVDEPGTPT